ncbi:MAG: permease, partial [Leptolyngbyaceae cyanobacterium MAG.088]|nr:permease [Leptolyngbyaceae cyanobacterium MAG.088]
MTSTVLNRFNRSFRQLDKVFIAIVLIFLALAILVPAQVSNSLGFTLRNLVQVFPFLLLSIGIAAYAQATGADNLIA